MSDSVVNNPSLLTLDSTSANACDFCGLPLPFRRSSDASVPEFCCYGCRFAASISATGGDEGQARWMMTKLGLAIFFSMNVMVCTLLLWSEETNQSEPLAATWYSLFRYAGLIFTVPVLLLLAPSMVEDAWSGIRQRRASSSVLLLLGVAASVGYSCYSVVLNGHVYYEVACTILLATTLGKWLEATGKLQATKALREMAKLMPEHVRVNRQGAEYLIPTNELQTGDSFRVLPGERVAADGAVLEGESYVDEQVVTGESVPVPRCPGDALLSGTMVVDGPLLIRATSQAGAGTIARMIAAVQAGIQARSNYERMAEKISQWFLPTICVVAGCALTSHAWNGNWERGFLAAVAVLVIACPCSLNLATPMALWAAIGRAAKEGILVRDGDAFSRFARIKTICFDKTGTLSLGNAHVAALNSIEPEEWTEVLAIASSLAVDSKHPLSVAIIHFAENYFDPTATTMVSTRHFAGRGIVGIHSVTKGECFLGSRRWLESLGISCNAFALPFTDDATETIVAWDGRAQGQFLVEEQLRSGVTQTMRELAKEQIVLLMLTGDRECRAKRFADSLGMQYRAELLPEDKLNALRSVPHLPVAMVGDGINDAPALAAADVGIALGSGSEIARHSAAICLLGNDLQTLPFLRRLATQAERTIRWNLLWALIYNLIGVGFAAAGWLHPVIAAIAMGASGLFVVVQSLALSQFELRDHRSSSPDNALPQTSDTRRILEGVASD